VSLSNRQFELIENSDGHASAKTIMKFSDRVDPFLGTYTGPNTIHGQVIVHTSPAGLTEMLYQSLTSDGRLVAGRAEVMLIEEENQPAKMQLRWQWLTGSLTSGISIWREIAGRTAWGVDKEK
jgi:hypothetical protein